MPLLFSIDPLESQRQFTLFLVQSLFGPWQRQHRSCASLRVVDLCQHPAWPCTPLFADWNVPDTRTDLKWHAMVRLYNAFCVHAVLPRFKLSTSLPTVLRNYLHTLVKGATEEVRAVLCILLHEHPLTVPR